MIPILTETETKALIRWHKSHTHLQSVGSKQDYMGVRKMHIQNEYIRTLFQKVENHCLGEIFKATGKVYYAEMSSITSWHNGGYQNPHLDTYSNQEMELNTFHGQPSREWTCILYLNDDLKGGETYIPQGKFLCHDNVEREYPPETFPPQATSGLLFQGIYIPHGVSKVRRNDRYTISLWFSSNLKKQMMTHPIHLDDNEDSFRLHLDEKGPTWPNPEN